LLEPISGRGGEMAEEISTADLAEVTERIAQRLHDVTPPTVTFHQPTIRPEAIVVKAHPAEPIYKLRLAVYEAIAEALGTGRFHEPLPGPDQYRPHVSAAYVNHNGPAEPIIDALSEASPQPVTVTFRTVPILTFHRDHRMYEWTDARSIPIGRSSASYFGISP
jgi:hypothetical protein